MGNESLSEVLITQEMDDIFRFFLERNPTISTTVWMYCE